MSRVFEALNKASEEKQRQAEKIPETIKQATEAFAERDGQGATQWQWEANGKDFNPSVAGTANGTSKSWRERFEELFFGWDLRRYTSYPIVALDKNSPATEQYKILREQIKRLRGEQGIKTFAITSPVKRDGKTTVAVNLAVVLSLDYEEKVLLIDGDLRAPAVHRYFNLPRSPGLTEYLGSDAYPCVKDLVRQTFLPGLAVLPAGQSSEFSSELLAKGKMSRVMEEIRSEFAGYQIIFDSPPILSTPDPLVIGRQVDGVLMVVRAGRTPRDYMVKALQSFSANKLMGVVLNGAELGMGSKYYYYYSARNAN